MNNTISTYEQQAIDFANKYGVKLSIGEPSYKDYWNDGTYRWVFPCSLKRGRNRYSFKFGQSIAEGSNNPTMYDVLACLTKYDPGTFEDFCGEFGYDTDSRKAYKTYKAVKREWENVAILFNDEQLDMLREIN
jgi:hypothetical protein